MNKAKTNWMAILAIAAAGCLLVTVAGMFVPRPFGVPVIVSSSLLLVLFASMLAVASVQMLRDRNPKNEKYDSSPIAKVLAALIAVAIITSIVTTIKSLWLDPTHAKFVYENIAAAAGLGSMFLVLILSSVQKDTYWINRGRTLKLDERQLKERQQVFETSYKLGVFILAVIAWFTVKTFHNIPAIINLHHNSVPGHLFWLPFTVVVMFFALPLIVAAWRKR